MSTARSELKFEKVRIDISPEQQALLAQMDAFEEKFPGLGDKYNFFFRGEEGSSQVVVAVKDEMVAQELTTSPHFAEFSDTFVVEITNFTGLKNQAIAKFGERAVSTLYGVPVSTLFHNYAPVKNWILERVAAKGFDATGVAERLDQIAHENAHNTYIQAGDFFGNIIDQTNWSGIKLSRIVGIHTEAPERRACMANIIAGNWDAVPLKEEDNTPDKKEHLRIDLTIYMCTQKDDTTPETPSVSPPRTPTRASKIRAILDGVEGV